MASYTMNTINAGPNFWEKKLNDKTAKCETCGDKVKSWCYQCNGGYRACGRRICSLCLEAGSEKSEWQKGVAQNHILVQCWHNYPGNMNPKFRHWKPLVPRRTEEEAKDKEVKRVIAANKKRNTKGSSSSETTTLCEDDSPILVHDLPLSLPDEDYDQPQGFTAVNIATRPQRESIKRKKCWDHDSANEVFVNTSSGRQEKTELSKRAQQVQQDVGVNGEYVDEKENVLTQLHDSTTVVVGAGVVGLFIARGVALVAENANIEHQVVVIELRESYCELASGYSAGFLSTKDMPEDWNSIATLAKQWWLEVRDQLQFNSNTTSEIVDGILGNHGKAPSWLRQDVDYSILEDIFAIGQVSSTSLTSWLYEQCLMLGVKFCFGKSITKVEFDQGSILAGVQFRNATGELNSVEGIPCSNIVLAAGPFTTGIFNNLFPNSELVFDNHVQGADWFKVKTSTIGSEGSTALRFPHAADSEDRLSNEIYMVADPSDNSIAISGTTARVSNKALTLMLAKEPGRGKTGELKRVSAKYLDVDEDYSLFDRGRSELSVANGMHPIIDRVPASGLGLACKDDKEDWQACGVWMCYGFGKHGTVLAPGAAEVLVSKMFGRRPDSADVDMFLVPGGIKPHPKGKGKARAQD